ncbi:hypothetical protein [Streptomyces clavifer]|uniref:hypothetical protein n=1 Tax=Streptomyces clavifer TaxID=68188 RepID=UPI0033B89087
MQERGRSRDREARFEALVGVVAEPLHRYLRRRAEPGAVDDVLAETMLVLWRRLEDVPGLGAGHRPEPAGVLPAIGMTPNAVSIRMHRAKRRLAAMLERKNGVPAAGDRAGWDRRAVQAAHSGFIRAAFTGRQVMGGGSAAVTNRSAHRSPTTRCTLFVLAGLFLFELCCSVADLVGDRCSTPTTSPHRLREGGLR